MKQETVYQKRERRIELIKQQLLRKSMPRLQMTVILSLTGLLGFLASFSLLHSGVSRMWVRYPIAILIAYGAFLLLLRLWLWVHGRYLEVDAELPELDDTESGSGEVVHFGGGKDFSGAGSGGSWGESAASSSSANLSSSSSSSGIGFDLDLEEGWLIVIAIIALLAGVIASLYIIYAAPVLLAEILVDGVLLAGLYKRVKHIDQRHWLRAAVRRTILAALLVAVLFAVAGYAMQSAVPEARSIGDVWKRFRNPRVVATNYLPTRAIE